MEDQTSGSPVVNHVSPIQSESVRSFPPSQEHRKLNAVPQRGSFELTESSQRPHDHSGQQSFGLGQTQEGSKHQEKVGTEIYQETRKQQRVCCGIRLWLLICVAFLILLIVIAALLGGILGSRGHGESKKPLPTVSISSATTSASSTISTNARQALPTPRESSGIATLDPGTNDHALLYYQLSNGSVIEVSFPIDDFNITTQELVGSNWTLVTEIADHGSALAAVSWQESTSDVSHYQLFFTQEGYLWQINRSWSDTTWNLPTQVVGFDTLAPGSPALCVLADFQFMLGIRVYYGSQEGGIQEMAYYNNTWTQQEWFAPADTQSGVGCTIQINPTQSWANVYWRNSDTGEVNFSWIEFHDNRTESEWQNGSNSSKIMNGSHISAAYDGINTDYVYVQSSESIQRASVGIFTDGSWDFIDVSNGTNSASIYAWYIPGNDPMAVIQYDNGSITVSSYSYSGDLNYNKTVV